jgi:hypothetical protein
MLVQATGGCFDSSTLARFMILTHKEKIMSVILKPEYEEDKVEELYDIIEEILEEDRKSATNTIIMGDWNSVVGDKAHHNIVGPYGLGRRNQRGQMLIDFCERNGLVITNT